jgi:hypothetical protein
VEGAAVVGVDDGACDGSAAPTPLPLLLPLPLPLIAFGGRLDDCGVGVCTGEDSDFTMVS